MALLFKGLFCYSDKNTLTVKEVFMTNDLTLWVKVD